MAATEPHLELVKRLVPLLLEGEDQRLRNLQKQWQVAEVKIQCETNWGFYAYFGVPEGMEKVEPPDFAGGNAVIKVEGIKNDAGCILYVRNGELDFLEVYTYDEPWEPPPHFGAITQHLPIVPGENAPRQNSTSRAAQ
jgi:hypothetical protein